MVFAKTLGERKRPVLTTGGRKEDFQSTGQLIGCHHIMRILNFYLIFFEITIFRQNYVVACNQKQSTIPKLFFTFLSDMYPNFGLSPVHDHQPSYLKIWKLKILKIKKKLKKKTPTDCNQCFGAQFSNCNQC